MGLGPRIFALLLLPSLLTSLQAQTPKEDSSAITVKARVQRVLVDVVVTTGKGEPVSGLPRKDFEVFEDGKPQKITSFEEHRGAPLTEILLPLMPPHVYTNYPVTKTADSVNVILLDMLNTPAADQTYVHSQLVKYLKTIQLGTPVAIFTLSSRLRMLQGVTTDPGELLAAVNSRQGLTHPSEVLDSGEVKEAFHQMYGFLSANGASQPPANLTQEETNVPIVRKENLAEENIFQIGLRIRITLEAFQQLARYLGGVPDRKNVIWFSGAFATTIFPSSGLPDPSRGVKNLAADFALEVRKMVDLLAAGRVALYPVGAEGLAGDSAFEANGEEIGGASGVEAAQDLAGQVESESVDRGSNYATMEELARDTGGKAYYNTNGLGDALGRVLRNGTQYYSLTYAPSNTTMDGKYRHIRVTLLERKDTLAYRRGYYADDLGATLAAGTKPDVDPLIPLVGRNMPDYSQVLYKVLVQPVTPQPPADLRHIGSNPDLKGPVTRFGVDFAIALSDLRLDPVSDGTRHGNIEVALAAYDREGKPLNMVTKMGEVSVQPNEYAAFKKVGLQIHQEIDVPGDYVYLRTGIYDMRSGAAGTLGVPLANAIGQPAKGKIMLQCRPGRPCPNWPVH